MMVLTRSNHWVSPCGTTGVRGSSEMVSGRMTWPPGLSNVLRMAANCERSLVNTSQAPER